MLCIQLASAQTGFSFTKNTATPDTVSLGTDIPFTASIQNDTGSLFAGVITFEYTIDGDTTAITVSDTSSGLEFSPLFTILNSGDSAVSSMILHVKGPRFQVGPSVVVIWPKANNASALDSIVFNLFILPPTGLVTTADDKMRVFVSDKFLHIESAPETELKRVRIMDISGKELLVQLLPAHPIPLPEMYAGVYLAEITYNNNQRKVLRFVY